MSNATILLRRRALEHVFARALTAIVGVHADDERHGGHEEMRLFVPRPVHRSPRPLEDRLQQTVVVGDAAAGDPRCTLTHRRRDATASVVGHVVVSGADALSVVGGGPVAVPGAGALAVVRLVVPAGALVAVGRVLCGSGVLVGVPSGSGA